MQASLNSQDYSQNVECSIQLTLMGMLAQNFSIIDLAVFVFFDDV